VTGARLAGLARRVLRTETFTLVAAPAIADLQFEAPGASWIVRARGYATVTATIARVAVTDMAADLGLVPGVAHGAWPSAATFWHILAISVAYYAFLLWFLVGLSTSTVSLLAFFARADVGGTVLVVAVLLGASVVSAVALCLPSRRHAPAGDDTP